MVDELEKASIVTRLPKAVRKALEFRALTGTSYCGPAQGGPGHAQEPGPHVGPAGHGGQRADADQGGAGRRQPRGRHPAHRPGRRRDRRPPHARPSSSSASSPRPPRPSPAWPAEPSGRRRRPAADPARAAPRPPSRRPLRRGERVDAEASSAGSMPSGNGSRKRRHRTNTMRLTSGGSGIPKLRGSHSVPPTASTDPAGRVTSLPLPTSFTVRSPTSMVSGSSTLPSRRCGCARAWVIEPRMSALSADPSHGMRAVDPLVAGAQVADRQREGAGDRLVEVDRSVVGEGRPERPLHPGDPGADPGDARSGGDVERRTLGVDPVVGHGAELGTDVPSRPAVSCAVAGRW